MVERQSREWRQIDRSWLVIVFLIIIAAVAFIVIPAKSPSGNLLAAAQKSTREDPWRSIFKRLDGLPVSAWTASAKADRFYPYTEPDRFLTIRAADVNRLLTQEELSSLDLVDAPWTIVLLRYENETSFEIPIWMTDLSNITLVASDGSFYSAIDVLEAAVASLGSTEPAPIPPSSLLDHCLHYSAQAVPAGARTYKTLIFPKVEQIKQINIEDYLHADYKAILRFR